MGHHSQGNIHALRFTTGSVCFRNGQAAALCVQRLRAALAQPHTFERLKESGFQDEFSESLRPTAYFG